MIKHHLSPEQSLDNYNINQARLPPRDDLNEIDNIIHNDEISRAELKARIELQPVNLTSLEIDSLLDFLKALTDTASLDMRNTVPYRVPSGLPMAD